MEIEPSPPTMVAKKLWNMVRVLFYMIRKSLTKSKITVDLYSMLKRGKLASKTLVKNLMFHYQYSCRSKNSFISPHEYEFSCSNSPTNPIFHLIKRKHRQYKYDDVSTLNAVQKVLEILNSEKVEVVNKCNYNYNSPLPGFGKSPIGRQLRVTDSPFPLKDEGDNHQVDMAAEEFIRNFYKDLNSQNIRAAQFNLIN